MNIHKLKKPLVVLCLAISIGLLVSDVGLFYYFHNGHLPNLPIPAIGRVYPSNNHGSIVYLTKSENDFRTLLQLGGMLTFFIAFVLNKKWQVFKNPLEGLSPEQRYKILHSNDD